ncbi:MAG: hypothetical protein UT32_C0037G0001, partial [Parcubacteria group bacterium GW2011_GWC2_39_14]
LLNVFVTIALEGYLLPPYYIIFWPNLV